MALAHTRFKVLSRSKGSTVANLAYRGGVKLRDDQVGKTYDYRNKKVQEVELLLPEGAPCFWKDLSLEIQENRQQGLQRLSDIVEASEKRVDAQIYRELEFSLPRELTDDQCRELAREFAQDQLCGRGMAVLLNFHMDVGEDGQRKPHCHALMLTRPLAEEGLASHKERSWNDQSLGAILREQVIAYTNFHLKKHGHDITLDHRSYKEQGIDLEPQVKLGPKVFHGRNKTSREQNKSPEEQKILEASRVLKDQVFPKDVDLESQIKRPSYTAKSFHKDLEEKLDKAERLSLRNVYRLMKRPEIILEKMMYTTFMWGDVEKVLSQHVKEKHLFQILSEKLREKVVLLRETEEGEVFTTQKRLYEEKKILEASRVLKERKTHGVSYREETLEGLSEDQKAMVRLSVEEGALVAINGYAGAGKTTALKVCKGIWEANGYKVYGLAPTGKAAQGLRDAGISSQTLHRFMLDVEGGRNKLKPRSVLILDEASMVDASRMKGFLEMAKTQKVKVVMCGDLRQLPSVEAGSAFRLVTDEVGMGQLTHVVRQKEEWQREATKCFGRGETQKALEIYQSKGCIYLVGDKSLKECLDQQDWKSLAYGFEKASPMDVDSWGLAVFKNIEQCKEYLSHRFAQWMVRDVPEEIREDRARFIMNNLGLKEDPEFDSRWQAKEELIRVWSQEYDPEKSYLILAHTNKDVRDLNERARSYLKEKGFIDEKDVLIKTKTKQGQEETRFFAVGDKIVFLRNDKGLGVRNGTLGTIKHLSKKEITVSLEEREVTFSPDLMPYIDYGFALTIHKSQASNVALTYLLASTGVNGNLSYVGMTRHWENVKVFASEFKYYQDLIQCLSKTGNKLNAYDYTKEDLYQRKKLLDPLMSRIEAIGFVTKEALDRTRDYLFDERPQRFMPSIRKVVSEERRWDSLFNATQQAQGRPLYKPLSFEPFQDLKEKPPRLTKLESPNKNISLKENVLYGVEVLSSFDEKIRGFYASHGENLNKSNENTTFEAQGYLSLERYDFESGKCEVVFKAVDVLSPEGVVQPIGEIEFSFKESLGERGLRVEFDEAKLGPKVFPESPQERENKAKQEKISLENMGLIMKHPELILDEVSRMESTFVWEVVEKELSHYMQEKHLSEGLGENVRGNLWEKVVLIEEGGILTTEKRKEEEQKILEASRVLKERKTHGVFYSEEVLEGLYEDQKAMVRRSVEEGALVAINGYAGAGKTTALKVCKDIWEANGYKVYGLAPTGKSAQGLRDAEISAQTLHRFMLGVEGGRNKLTSRSVLILDEASMVDVVRMKGFLEMAMNENVKVVMCGDRLQLPSVEAGSAFRLVTDEVGMGQLTHVVRQKEEWQRKATEYFGLGKTEEALWTYVNHGYIEVIHIKDFKDYVREQDWRSLAYGFEKNAFIFKNSEDLDPWGLALLENIESCKEHLSQPETLVKWMVRDVPKEIREDLSQFIRRDLGLKEGSKFDHRRKAMDALIEAWSRDYDPEKSYLIMAHTNKDVRDLNERARTVLKNKGLIDQEDFLFKTKDAQENESTRLFAAGDKIVFLKNDKDLGVNNGTMGILKSLSSTEMTVLIDGNKEVTFSPDLMPYIDHGFALTIHKSQGATVDLSYLLASSFMDAYLIYVALTRHRENVYVFSEDFKDPQGLIEKLSKMGKKMNAYDYTKEGNPLPKKPLGPPLPESKIEEADVVQDLDTNLDINHLLSDEKLKAVMPKFKKKLSKERRWDDLFNPSQKAQGRPLYKPLSFEVDIKSPNALKGHHQEKGQGGSQRIDSYNPDKNKSFKKKFLNRMEILSSFDEEKIKRFYESHEEHIGRKLNKSNEKGVMTFGAKGSFRVKTRTGQWYDFEDGQGGGIFKFLEDVVGLSKDAATERAIAYGGTIIPHQTAPKFFVKEAPDSDHSERIEAARSIWDKGGSFKGSLGEKYLREHRKICGEVLSAKVSKNTLIFKAQNEKGEFTGVQRIFLEEKSGKKITGRPAKLSKGVVKGSFVVFKGSIHDDVVYMAEGPETALSISSASPPGAVISTLGVHNMRNMPFKAGQHVVMCADNGDIPVKEIQKSLEEKGVSLSIIRPPVDPDNLKNDFNDLHQKEGLQAVKKIIEEEVSQRVIKMNQDVLPHVVMEYFKHQNNDDQRNALAYEIIQDKALLKHLEDKGIKEISVLAQALRHDKFVLKQDTLMDKLKVRDYLIEEAALKKMPDTFEKIKRENLHDIHRRQLLNNPDTAKSPKEITTPSLKKDKDSYSYER